MPDILLATINAKYAHAAFGLRYLRANLGRWREHSEILELTPNLSAIDMAEAIVARAPKIVGLGAYIWNIEATLELAETLRLVLPEAKIVVGGPEVSHETETQHLCEIADYVICGEGELAFAELCERLLTGRRPLQKIIRPAPPELSELASPYAEYDDVDLARRVVYVEASRGCPFRCEFCLSSLDQKVRGFDLPRFLADMQTLLDRGLRSFKFVDRTFNLDIATSSAILEFFLARIELGLFLHFELIPDRLPDRLRDIIARFPKGALQFEVGVQTLDAQVARDISRRTNLDKLEQNLAFLRSETHVHVHADLIIGLPGEDSESFARGLDRLHAMGPHEIQVGILKRLRGTPIIRHTKPFGLVFAPRAPYQILKTAAIDFAEMRRLARFAHVWDRVVNRGHFGHTVALLFEGASPYAVIAGLSEFLFSRHGRVHALALEKLAFALDDYGRDELSSSPQRIRSAVVADMDAAGHKLPRRFLAQADRSLQTPTAPEQGLAASVPRRQRLHVAQPPAGGD